MLDVKTVALRVLELVATDHERVVEVGRCGGFQVSVLHGRASEIDPWLR